MNPFYLYWLKTDQSPARRCLLRPFSVNMVPTYDVIPGKGVGIFQLGKFQRLSKGFISFMIW